jgi:two-component sensor histidine kinase
MISALLAMQARNLADPEARGTLASMLQRVESIGTVHRRLYQSKDVQVFDLADFVRDIAHELLKACGREDVNLVLDLATVKVPSQQASAIALMLNELIMNALKHAFPERRPGTLFVDIRQHDDLLHIIISDDGVGMPAARDRSGFGNRLIKTLARQLQADVVWLPGDPGTIVDVKSPLKKLAAEQRNE